MPVGPLQANCYFVYDIELGSGLVVDPGDEAERIEGMVASAGVELKGILLTHGHSDHIGGTAGLAASTGAIVYGSDEARQVLAEPERHILFPGMPAIERGAVDELLSGDSDLDVGGIAVRAIATPGHTRGSFTFEAGGGLYCGDLLFRGSVGRTDLDGGSFEELAASVRKLVLRYPGDTTVFPGHGSSTTLEQEKEDNPFLTDLGW